MPTLEDIHVRQGKYLDSMSAAFEEHLRAIISRAETATIARLQKGLAITDGEIDQTPGNLRLMRRTDTIFLEEMDRAGYQRLVTAFVSEFPGQLPFLQETLEAISAELQSPLPPLQWTARDLNVFSGFQASSTAGIKAAVQGAAMTARNRIMLSVGGLEFKSLLETLKDAFSLTLARAKTWAETSQTIFYRTATDRAFQAIEADMPDLKQEYAYSGPDDKKTRPFCHAVLKRTAKAPMTRAEIDKLDNGMLPNVFLTGGGWACRHAWILDVRALKARMAQAA